MGAGMHPAVDLRAERQAGRFQPGEALIGAQQVRVAGDQVGGRDAHRGLRTALRFGVGHHTRRHRQPVVAGRFDHGRVADRDPSHMGGGHGLLVVGQCVRRATTKPAQRGVDASDDRRQRLVQDGQHHPKTRPRQPRAEQPRLDPAHQRAVPVVELEPHARLRHPRPVNAAPPGHIGLLGRRHRPARRALRAPIAHRHQLVMGHIGADLAVRRLHPLLQLGQERVDELVPPGRLTQRCPRPGPRHGGRRCDANSRPAHRHPGNCRSNRMPPEFP